MTAPCHGCPDRHELCHSQCPKYQEYRQEREELRKFKAQENAIQHNERIWEHERKKLNKFKRYH